MLTLYSKFEKILYEFEKVIVTLLMIIMFISVFLQVLSRYFQLPVPDTSDISLISFAMMTFIGAGLLVYTKGHISIEITSLIKSQKLVYIFDVLSKIAMLVIIGILLNIGLALLIYSIESGETTAALRLPLFIPYSALVTGLILMLVHTIGDCWELLSNQKAKNTK